MLNKNITIELKLVNINIFSEKFVYVDFDQLSYGHKENMPLKGYTESECVDSQLDENLSHIRGLGHLLTGPLPTDLDPHP